MGPFGREDWPDLFPLLTLAADLPRLAGHRSLSELPVGLWPELEGVAADVVRLQRMVDHPVVPAATAVATCHPRDTYTLTLSLQDLDPAGIGWHRDLYWPREWVGEDVFAVLYGLDADSPETGGAFVYYVPWENEDYARYRQRHEATILWNARQDSGRILHAVSGYHGEDTSRHLLILQCLRRG